jgi:hypothetical protein
MPEWVDYQHINEHHKFQTVETWSSGNTSDPPPTTCWICGKGFESHWFPISDAKKLADLHQQVYDIADEVWNNES